MAKIDEGFRFAWIALGVIALVVLCVYAQTATFDFVNFDDDQYVYENQHVASGLNPANIAWAFTNVSHMCWQPLTWLSHMLDCQLAGLNPAWPHIHNMLLHLGNSILLFLLFHAITGARWRSLLLGVLFAVHPLGVDSVAWISERKNLLATFFMLLSIYAYFGYTLQKRAATYFVALAFFAAGLLSKPSIVTLPFVLLLFDFWPYQRIALGGNSSFGTMTISNMRFFGRLVMEKIPFFALSTLYLGIFTFSLGRLQAGVSTESVSLALRLANALVSYVNYGWNVLWPNNLAVYYPFPQSIPAWQAVSSGLFILVITIFVLIVFRRRPFFAVGWFWFLGTLVPVIGIAQVGLWPARADRWVYLPMVGVLIMLVWGCGLALDKIRLNERFVAGVVTTVLLIYAAAAHLQTSYWRDSVTLFQRTVKVTQNNFVAHDNLGLALAMNGRFDEAFQNFSEALRIAPSFWKAQQNLGAIYLIKGNYELAILYLKKALEGKPNSARIHNNLGRIYKRQGRKAEAAASFRKALDLDPGNSKAIENLKRLRLEG
jgi:tetratricopeptide (TPR) repeat protein